MSFEDSKGCYSRQADQKKSMKPGGGPMMQPRESARLRIASFN